MTTDAEERQRFLDAVMLHPGAAAEPVRTVVTLRDDFVTRLSRIDRVFLLRSPDAGALRSTIVEPLRRAGYRLETPAMLDAIERELDGGAGQLPLLQFTLRKLWDTRDEVGRVLRETAYRAIGGVGGALSKHGELVLTGLPAGELPIARALLLRLVSTEATRQIVSRMALLDGLPGSAEVVLVRLTEARLVVQRRSVADDETLVELAHEALIVRWETLAGWIAETREERALAAELGGAAALWASRGRRPTEVWTGDALRSALHRVRVLGLAVPQGSPTSSRPGVQPTSGSVAGPVGSSAPSSRPRPRSPWLRSWWRASSVRVKR